MYLSTVWIWTEPHSMRLKIKITIQKEVINGAILQQVIYFLKFLSESNFYHSKTKGNCGWIYHPKPTMQKLWSFLRARRMACSCASPPTSEPQEDLLLSWTNHSQTRCSRRLSSNCGKFLIQKIDILLQFCNKWTFLWKTFRDGMDFYFKEKNLALRFNEFLTCHVPAKVKYSRKLVSADHCSNVGDFKHNFLVDIAPICKVNLLCNKYRTLVLDESLKNQQFIEILKPIYFSLRRELYVPH